MNHTKEVTILIVDDDNQERKYLQRKFQKNGLVDTKVIEARDGSEGLQILRGERADISISQPYVILLDLNMPVLDGFEFLDQLRTDPKLKRSLVLVMTTSNDDEDKCRAYDKNISGYIVKDNVEKGDVSIQALIKNFISLVEFPKE